MTLAALGFTTISAFLALIFVLRMPVIFALVMVPVIAAAAGGFAEQLNGFAIDGLRTVAPVAALLMFAVLYFGLMIDVGLFDPIVRRVSRATRGDPVRLCILSVLLPMAVALDGDGSTTFLISITALLPLHRAIGIRPVVLPVLVGLAAGVMNLLPWGGPTARAMAALDKGVDQIFTPVAPAMLAGIIWVVATAWWIGLHERRRLHAAAIAQDAGTVAEQPVKNTAMTTATDRGEAASRGRFAFNAGLTIVLLILLFRDLYAIILPIPAVPAPLLFMIAYGIALPVNRPGLAAQQAQLAAHAPSVVLVTSMIMASGIFTGILTGSGMTGAMGVTAAAALPAAAAPWLPQIVAATGVPLSLVFTPDAFYFGIVPVLAEAAGALGHDPAAIGRAAILGQMTTGFPMSPLTASTFVLIGLSGVTLRDLQRALFPLALLTTAVMTLVATAIGAI